MGKKIGNEIPWYKPFALVRRNKELEELTLNQYTKIRSYKLVQTIADKALDENKQKEETIKNLEKNIEIHNETIQKLREICRTHYTSKVSKEILKEIGE